MDSEANELPFLERPHGLFVAVDEREFLQGIVLDVLKVLLDVDGIKESQQFALLKTNVLKVYSSFDKWERDDEKHSKIYLNYNELS